MNNDEIVDKLCQFLSDYEDGAKPEELISRVEWLAETRTTALAWKEAVIDALVIHWCLNKENRDDPRRAISDLLTINAAWALDERISKAAADLIQLGRDLQIADSNLILGRDSQE